LICHVSRRIQKAKMQDLAMTTGWPKKLAPFFVRLNLTDFQNYFTARIRRKLVKCVVTKVVLFSILLLLRHLTWCHFFGLPCTLIYYNYVPQRFLVLCTLSVFYSNFPFEQSTVGIRWVRTLYHCWPRPLPSRNYSGDRSSVESELQTQWQWV